MSVRYHRIVASAAMLTAGALVLVGCAGSSGAGGSSAAGASSDAVAPGDPGVFPVTFDTLYGETTIESAPARVATWGWGATDAVLALGVMPVAIPSDDYSGGDDKIQPWISDAIDELGGEPPVVLDNSTYELDVEELLASDPDVLIAPYSGITQEEYDAVTAAGVPVLAPEEALWSTPWRDVITLTGQALGLESEADAVVDGVDQEIADAAAAHPEFAGTSILFVTGVDPVYVYLQADPRVQILEDLGFTTPENLPALDSGEATFYTTVSPENVDQLVSDVVVTYAADDAELQTFLTSPVTTLIPAVASGTVASVTGVENVSALTPTALATPYILSTLVDALAAAIAKG